MKYIEEASSRGRDPLKLADRQAMARYACDVCGAALLLVEIGPHFRIRHADERPSVTDRATGAPSNARRAIR
jgi:hypothetical protein